MKSARAPMFLPSCDLTEKEREALGEMLIEMTCVFATSPSSSLHFSPQWVSLYHSLTVCGADPGSPAWLLFSLWLFLSNKNYLFWVRLSLMLSPRAVVPKVWSLKPAAAFENLLEMPIPVPHPRTDASEPLGLGPRGLCLYRLSTWFWGAQVWGLTALEGTMEC